FRRHVVEVESRPKPINTYDEPKWPEWALAFDTETTLDPKEQALTFGWYRVCRLQGKNYVCVEEGIVNADDLSSRELDTIQQYVHSRNSEVISENYDE